MSEIPKHPVDALKSFGLDLPPDAEARMRAICDEEVYSKCGCSVKDGHTKECQEAKAVIE